MIDFVHVGTPTFLRITFWVAMETMHFRVAKISCFYDKMFRKLRYPMKDMAPMRNCHVGCKVASNLIRGKSAFRY